MGSRLAPNHSCLVVIEEDHLLEGTRLLSSFEIINSIFIRKEFCKACRRFLEDFVSTILSTVAARSTDGKNLSCFSPKTVTGRDGYSTFHLFGQLLEGLIELGWVSGPEAEPAKAELLSFFRKQREVEVSGSKLRVPINSAFAFSNQPCLRSRGKLYKASVIVFRNNLDLLMILRVCCFQVFQLTALVVKGPSELHPILTVSLDGVAIDYEKVNWAVPCVQDSVRHPLYTQRNHFSETRISMLNTAIAAVEFDPWRGFGAESDFVIADLKTVSGESFAAEEASQIYTGALVWCRHCCIISGW